MKKIIAFLLAATLIAAVMAEKMLGAAAEASEGGPDVSDGTEDAAYDEAEELWEAAEADPEEEPIDATGDWYAEMENGLPMKLSLEKDGRYTFRLPGESAEGLWTQEDDRILLDGETRFPLDLFSGEMMLLSEADVLFTREPYVPYVPEKPMEDTELAWFGGYWTGLYEEVDGTPVPASALENNTDLYIDGTVAALGGDYFGDIFWHFQFEHGGLHAQLDDGRNVTIAFQQDSLLRMTISGGEEEAVVFLAPEWSETLDGEAIEDMDEEDEEDEADDWEEDGETDGEADDLNEEDDWEEDGGADWEEDDWDDGEADT